MKNFIILFLTFLSFDVLSETTFPVNISGNIVEVHFDTPISNSNDYTYQSEKLERTEELKITTKIFEALCEYNYKSRIKYVPDEIYICTNIVENKTNEQTYGVNLKNNAIVLNIQNENFIGTLHHEICHTIINQHYEFWPDNFLLKLYREVEKYTDHGEQADKPTLENGYVNQYASTHIIEDLCEMYEDLMVYKIETMHYIKENPNSKLALKFGLLVDSFNKNLDYGLSL
jgi:hypothetical protein